MAANQKLIRALKRKLESMANIDQALKMQVYMKSAMPFYGVKAPAMKEICKEAFKEYPMKDFHQWYDTVLALWRNAKFREERHCAILLCEAKHYLQYQTLETIPLYEEMIVTGAWWDYVDVIAAHRMAYLLKKFPKKIKPLMRQWSKQDDIWKRRTAILCQLLFKGETDLKLLYACIKPSLKSDEFFLQKAIGWALRSYAWYDIDEILRYVGEHEHQLSKLSKREALKNKDKILSRP